jgi:pilin/secretion family protein with methylation motif
MTLQSGFCTCLRDERGTTLIEVSIAVAILLVVMAGLLGMAAAATSMTENQGHLSARTTEYAVDKMEQMLELTYGDAQSNTTVFPSINTGGTGLAVGGSSDPSAPVVGYTDYLDQSGNVLCTAGTPCTATPPTDWFYERVWQISTPSANLKQITVTAIVRQSVARAVLSQSTVSAYKTNCPTGC